MSIEFEKKYHLDDAFEVQVRDDKVLYVDYQNGNWFRTNCSGHELLGIFDGKLTVREVIEKYAQIHEFPVSVIQNRVAPFILRAKERKLLLDENEQRPDISVEFGAYPNDLWIHVTDMCNMHCPFCYSSSGSAGVQNLDLIKTLHFVSQIPLHHRHSIIISGGEPMLYPDIVEFVKELKAMNFKVTVISNGTAEPEKYDSIIPYLDTLQISIDGATEDVYQCTRGKGSYQKAVNTLDHAFKQGMRNIVVSFTTNRFNIAHIQEMAEFARLHHVNHLHITKIIPSGRANDVMDKIVPTPLEYGEAIKRLSEAVNNVNKQIATMHLTDEIFVEDEDKTQFITLSVSSDPVEKAIRQTKITTCSLGTGTVSIGYDSKIYPCGCLHLPELELGTLDDPIEDVLRKGRLLGESFSVENTAMAECNACKYKYICGGGCRACANSCGKPRGKDPMCEFYINRIESIMWDSPISALE